ncbi:uncharacterized protein LOC131845457 [Achroia grisella]|uniref:uncharacterized protein LOC131845457 n=1 Tax=Achroia grisella TaxID=688607 RepID=UPI0027D1FCF6|nr:uncharacterized protein LOC131845457 [Achroia grisella]
MMGAYNLPLIPYFAPTSPMNLQNDINMMQYYNNIPSMPMYSGLNNNYNMMTKAHDSLYLNNMPMDHRTTDTVPNKVLAGNTDDKLVPNNNINVMMISQTPVAPNNILLGYTDENKSALTNGVVTENDDEVVVKNETSTVKYDENVATADVTNTLKIIKI